MRRVHGQSGSLPARRDAPGRSLDYPPAEPAPVTRSFGAVTFDDPYCWLEEETARNLDWQSAQDALAAGYLAALPAHAAMRGRIEAMQPSSAVLAPKFAGGRWFRQRVPTGEAFAVLETAEAPDGPGRRLLDLNALPAGEPLRLQHFEPSPDGRKVAVSWSRGSGDYENFQVLDAGTGALLVDGVPQLRAVFPAWLPDSAGLYYAARDPRSSKAGGQVWLLRLGEPPPVTPETLETSHPLCWPVISGDGRHVLVYSSHASPRPEFIRPLDGDAPWRPFLQGVPGMFRGVVVGAHFYAITDDGAARGRLVAIPLATPTQRDTWRELVAPSDHVLASVVAVGARLVLVELADSYARLRVVRTDGVVEGEVALPGRGLVSTQAGVQVAINFMECLQPAGNEHVVFLYSSPTQSPTVCRASVVTRRCELLTPPALRLDAVVTDHVAPSRDGTPIPYRLVARRGAGPSRPRPTVVYFYAGLNVALLPGWPGEMLAGWVQAGGLLVLAQLRGGGEFGPDWWRAGRLANRQNTLDDLYAVTADLCARGVSSPAQLGAYGVSNGGTIAAAAAVQRPDLFAAVIAQAPFTDLFGLVRDPIGLMVSKDECGDPAEPAMSRVLRAWSPYHNVIDGTAYPAVLLDCGLADPRSPPWHGRKLAARLQRASASGRPVLLRVRAGNGQAPVDEAARRLEQSERLAFLTDELGLTT